MSSLDNRAILQQFIVNGRVKYDKLRDFEGLEDLIYSIEATNPDSLNHQESFAFWLNAYNIITLKAVLDELNKNDSWAGVTSTWRKFIFFVWKKHVVGQRKMSLYYLENKILRMKFKDPRLHFAINCASTSCPFLPTLLFNAETLDEYLEERSSNFINEQNGVSVTGNTIYLSEIFNWYSQDFGGQKQIIIFIQKYWKGDDPIHDHMSIQYQKYNWGLNNYS